MKNRNVIRIVPEPKQIKFTNKWFKFDGFIDFDEFISKEFNIKRGKWEIKEVKEEGIGIRVSNGLIEYWAVS